MKFHLIFTAPNYSEFSTCEHIPSIHLISHRVLDVSGNHHDACAVVHQIIASFTGDWMCVTLIVTFAAIVRNSGKVVIFVPSSCLIYPFGFEFEYVFFLNLFIEQSIRNCNTHILRSTRKLAHKIFRFSTTTMSREQRGV